MRNTWQAAPGYPEQAYDILSTVSHPRPRALRLAFDFDNDRPRIGPGYNKPLFMFTANNILVGAISIAAFLVRLISNESQKPLLEAMQHASDQVERQMEWAESLTKDINA